VASQQALPLKKANSIDREYDVLPEALIQELFTLKIAETSSPAKDSEGNYIIAQVTDINAPEGKEEEKLDTLRLQLQQDVISDMYTQLLTKLQNTYTISQ